MLYKDIQFNVNTLFLVTGGAGFVGSNLIEALLKLGVKVRTIDNISTGNKSNLSKLINYKNFEYIEGDIRNYDTCFEACKGVDYILHQAALGSVPRSIENPIIYEENNIRGTHNMMEAARQSGSVKRFIYASSSSVYGDSQKLPKQVGEEGKVLSPYALTKMVNERYGELYTNLYNLPCIGLRYFNVFGRMQDPHSQYAAVIPIFIKNLMKGTAPIIYGDGEQSRDFTYIENVIEANLKACIAPSKTFGKAYNIACGESYTINQVFNIIKEYFDIDILPNYVKEREGDIKHSIADITKSIDDLNYNPIWNFRDGFQETIEWYKRNIN